jgi:hypothetical protein
MQTRNTDAAFKGVTAIKDSQAKTLEMFREAARTSQWTQIHQSHYDWWMFPIDEPSAYGFAWTVFDDEIAELRQDQAYLARYLEAVNILATSWGWDLARACPIPDPQPDQCWQHWPIRLYKATKSVRLYGFPEEFASLRLFGQRLIKQGENMYYHRDLSWLFQT